MIPLCGAISVCKETPLTDGTDLDALDDERCPVRTLTYFVECLAEFPCGIRVREIEAHIHVIFLVDAIDELHRTNVVCEHTDA